MNSLERDVWDVSWTVVEMTSRRAFLQRHADNRAKELRLQRRGGGNRSSHPRQDRTSSDDEDERTVHHLGWRHPRLRRSRSVPS